MRNASEDAERVCRGSQIRTTLSHFDRQATSPSEYVAGQPAPYSELHGARVRWLQHLPEVSPHAPRNVGMSGSFASLLVWPQTNTRQRTLHQAAQKARLASAMGR